MYSPCLFRASRVRETVFIVEWFLLPDCSVECFTGYFIVVNV